MEATEVSFTRGPDKEDVVHTHSGLRWSLRKDNLLPFVTTRMDLENSMLCEVSQSERAKSRMILLTCGIEN